MLGHTFLLNFLSFRKQEINSLLVGPTEQIIINDEQSPCSPLAQFPLISRSAQCGRREGAHAVVRGRGRHPAEGRGRLVGHVVLHGHLHPHQHGAEPLVVRQPAGALHGSARQTRLRTVVLRYVSSCCFCGRCGFGIYLFMHLNAIHSLLIYKLEYIAKAYSIQ